MHYRTILPTACWVASLLSCALLCLVSRNWTHGMENKVIFCVPVCLCGVSNVKIKSGVFMCFIWKRNIWEAWNVIIMSKKVHKKTWRIRVSIQGYGKPFAHEYSWLFYNDFCETIIEVWSTLYILVYYSVLFCMTSYQSSKYLPVEAVSDHQVTRNNTN